MAELAKDLEAPVLSPGEAATFLAGVEHFNARRFWEAHESWEELWLEADAPVVDFYQGLIQLAAAYHHLQRGTFPGGVRLFDAARKRLEPYPPLYHNVDRGSAESVIPRHRTAAAEARFIDADEYPKLTIRTA